MSAGDTLASSHSNTDPQHIICLESAQLFVIMSVHTTLWCSWKHCTALVLCQLKIQYGAICSYYYLFIYFCFFQTYLQIPLKDRLREQNSFVTWGLPVLGTYFIFHRISYKSRGLTSNLTSSRNIYTLPISYWAGLHTPKHTKQETGLLKQLWLPPHWWGHTYVMFYPLSAHGFDGRLLILYECR